MYAALEIPQIARRTVVTLLLIHTGLLVYSAFVHSPTQNETAHLVAGLSHWQLGRFELYRINPPLVRMVAALPVLALDAHTDWSNFDESSHFVFGKGGQFVADNGPHAFWLFTVARWACIPFSWLGATVCYLWARDLYGRPAGVVASSLWCFCPNVLAHGSLITPDAASAALGIAAAYYFGHWLKSPTLRRAVGVGILLGVAELTKLTWLILFGLWPLLWLVSRLADSNRRRNSRAWLEEARHMALILCLGLYVINLGYLFEGSFTRLGDFEFISQSLTTNRSDDPVELDFYTVRNRFSDSWLGLLPLPLPKNYVSGIDIQRRDFEHFGRPSYLRGEFSDQGWWYYYLYALAIKVPLGTWLLFLLAIGMACCPGVRAARWIDVMPLAAPAAAVLGLVSSQTGINHHMRYVLPIFPFGFIWASQVAMVPEGKCGKTLIIIGTVVIWSWVSSLWIYPHSLSYFNELVGGPNKGHFHLIHSNIDWGQDLFYLKAWLKDRADAQPLHLAYYGDFDPRVAGIEFMLPPPYRPSDNVESHLLGLKPGWYAVSVNLLCRTSFGVADGRGNKRVMRDGALTYLDQLRPIAKAGYSIHIFKIP